MAKRLLVGSLLIAALVGIYFLDAQVLREPLASRILLWLVALAAMREVLTLGGRHVERSPGLSIFGGIAIVAVVVPSLVAGTIVPPVLLVIAALGAAVVRLLGMAPVVTAPRAWPEAALLGGGMLYVALPLSFLDQILVRDVSAGYVVVLVSKASDCCGYFVGTLLGRKRIAPAVSPKKTWEGTIAAVLGATGVAAIFEAALPGTRLFAAAVGAMIGAASFAGDLLE
jgi:phosphatidate cytidylyltransferase